MEIVLRGELYHDAIYSNTLSLSVLRMNSCYEFIYVCETDKLIMFMIFLLKISKIDLNLSILLSQVESGLFEWKRWRNV